MFVAWASLGIRLEKEAGQVGKEKITEGHMCHAEISELYQWELLKVSKKGNVFYNGLGLLNSLSLC